MLVVTLVIDTKAKLFHLVFMVFSVIAGDAEVIILKAETIRQTTHLYLENLVICE